MSYQPKETPSHQYRFKVPQNSDRRISIGGMDMLFAVTAEGGGDIDVYHGESPHRVIQSETLFVTPKCSLVVKNPNTTNADVFIQIFRTRSDGKWS